MELNCAHAALAKMTTYTACRPRLRQMSVHRIGCAEQVAERQPPVGEQPGMQRVQLGHGVEHPAQHGDARGGGHRADRHVGERRDEHADGGQAEQRRTDDRRRRRGCGRCPRRAASVVPDSVVNGPIGNSTAPATIPATATVSRRQQTEDRNGDALGHEQPGAAIRTHEQVAQRSQARLSGHRVTGDHGDGEGQEERHGHREPDQSRRTPRCWSPGRGSVGPSPGSGPLPAIRTATATRIGTAASTTRSALMRTRRRSRASSTAQHRSPIRSAPRTPPRGSDAPVRTPRTPTPSSTSARHTSSGARPSRPARTDPSATVTSVSASRSSTTPQRPDRRRRPAAARSPRLAARRAGPG